MVLTYQQVSKSIDFVSEILPTYAETLSGFWGSKDMQTKGVGSEEDYTDVFMDYLQERGVLCKVIQILLVFELDASEKAWSALREDSPAALMLSAVWYKKTGRKFLKATILPLLDQVGYSELSLEVDAKKAEKGVNVKKNMEFLLKATNDFIQRVYTTPFPNDFREVLTGIDTLLTKRFPNIGSSLAAGILFLRWINPAIIFPEKYELVKEDRITPQGRTGLLTIAKLLQRLANGEKFDEAREQYLLVANRFLKKQKTAWDSFFLKMINNTVVNEGMSPLEAIEISPDDLLAKSNMDYCVQCPLHLGKQRELVLRIFALEKQTLGWEKHTRKGHDIYMKIQQICGSTPQIMSKIQIEIPASVQETYTRYLQSKMRKDMKFRVVERMSENMVVKHSSFKVAKFPFRERDFCVLTYHEILPGIPSSLQLSHFKDDDFAVICGISMNRPDVPEVKGFVRGEIVFGKVIRGDRSDPNKCTVTELFHVDLKGRSSMMPKGVLKKDFLKMQENCLSTIKEWAEEKASSRKNSQDVSEDSQSSYSRRNTGKRALPTECTNTL